MVKPWLFIPASVSHKLAPQFLKLISPLKKAETYNWKPLLWKGLSFSNPLGIAGGFDKNADLAKSLWKYGPGFIEVGTVTPKPQKQNPGKVVDRSNKHQALWNCLGFPNKGLNAFETQLKTFKRPYKTPLFVNVGKNRNTTEEDAHKDYTHCIQRLEDYADVFVINISSPNTKGLRKLLEPKNLSAFLSKVLISKKPTLLKLSPDMSNEDILSVINVSHNAGVDGWILTNTTTQRLPSMSFPVDKGGVSGVPLQTRSIECLKLVSTELKAKNINKLLISVGGVSSHSDIQERLDNGAQLVQAYSSLIFEGLGFFKQMHNEFTRQN